MLIEACMQNGAVWCSLIMMPSKPDFVRNLVLVVVAVVQVAGDLADRTVAVGQRQPQRRVLLLHGPGS